MKRNKIAGHLMIIFTQVILGINIPITRDLLLHYLSPVGYIGIRALGAALFFWIMQCFAKREEIDRKDFVMILFGGFLGFVFSQYLTSLSLQYTTPVYFSLILALSPVVVLLLQAFCFGEKITRQKTIGIVLGIVGASILAIRAVFETDSQGTNNLLGIALAMLSVSSFAAYVVICGDISKKYRPVTQMKWIFTLSTVMTCPVWFLTGQYDTELIWTAATSHIGWLEIGFIIVFCTIAAYTLIPLGMRSVSATVVSIYMNLQPIVASATAILIGMDVFTWDKPLALLLVLLGAFVVTTDRPARAGEPVTLAKADAKTSEHP